MNEAKLIEKLRLIEALFSGAATDGEKVAAEKARERILKRRMLWEQEEPPVEHKFTMGSVALSRPTGQSCIKEPSTREDAGPKNSSMRKGKKHKKRKRKTTLLKLISGEIKPDSGTISLQKGSSIAGLSQELPAELT